jgi:hypothetical protein
MKSGNRRWVLLVAIIAPLLAALVLRPLPKPKARASRISAVNNVARVSLTIPGTNAPGDAAANKETANHRLMSANPWRPERSLPAASPAPRTNKADAEETANHRVCGLSTGRSRRFGFLR